MPEIRISEHAHGHRPGTCLRACLDAIHIFREISCEWRVAKNPRFEPCEWSDLSCHALVDVAGVSGTPLTGIVGHHKNAGTWLKVLHLLHSARA